MYSEKTAFTVDTKEIYCEGENHIIGHPKVFLNMGDMNQISCPYCSRHFIYNNHLSK